LTRVFTELSASELATVLAKREASAIEVAKDFLERIGRLDGDLGAFLTVSEEETLRWAEAAQDMLDRGTAGPLTGVPVAVKDNISTKGVPTSCASRVLEGYVPPFDATVVERLRAAGLVQLGKTNMDEFAMGTSTENSAFQPTRNPWDLERCPGGSSGGSAASVAGRLAPVALGSDTGGSIRMPAALCGVVGFKPSYGRCSRYGLVAFASSLDQIGSFGRSVEDAALLAEAISGHDPLDSTSLDLPPISAKGLKSGKLRGLKVALPKELFGEEMQPGVRSAVDDALAELAREGVELTEIHLPALKTAVTTYYIIAPAEASSNLARFDGIRYGPRSEGEGHIGVVARTRSELFGHEVKSRIMIGTYVLSAGYYEAYYNRAQQVRALMSREIETAFESFDLIVSPTSPVTAFKLGELVEDPLAMKLLDLCTIPANMAGLPALSLNCGFSAGLPVGLQLMAPALADEKLLQAAFAIERALPQSKGVAPFG
jgi:aspartyl-tRNA(Asn)/glutamyl-tRNA(Gln) amidotransferase subunit A